MRSGGAVGLSETTPLVADARTVEELLAEGDRLRHGQGATRVVVTAVRITGAQQPETLEDLAVVLFVSVHVGPVLVTGPDVAAGRLVA
jgi:hypothetical protein